MDNARLDRLLWLPSDDVDVRRVQSELTVAPLDFNGDAKDLIKLYEEAGTTIGVPRRWGLKNYGSRCDVVDCTVAPASDWTPPQWPEGWGYWKGQKSTIDDALAHLQSGTHESYGALLEAPCGAGKTLMATSIAAALNTPTLVLVHKGDLAQQWHELCHGADGKPGLWPDMKLGHVQQNRCDYEGCHMVTAMAQTIHSRRKKLPLGFFKNFGLVIYDEGHRYPARTFEEVMRLPHARWRLGISATWRRSDKLECIWNWHIGSVVARAKVARLSGDYAQVPWSTNLTDTMMKMYGGQINRNKWVTAITKNVAYNHWIASQVVHSQQAGRRTLVVSDRVQHCKDLCDLIRKKAAEDDVAIDVGLYMGDMKAEALEESKKCGVVIATYAKMGEGTDIPELDTLFLVSPRTDVEQVVGRIQRVVDGKKPLLIVDPVFTSSYNTRMANKRRAIYERLGFKKQEKK